ncbi:aminotransferase class V-fold PLP-dependent enzyme [Endozoicomonas arenosclerae]|uniref:aminotransferase class V-fold PLP-dependent enzyme n=1 Tax=Endozoicomonas arenosclerae TaxID=1633495 RepID=UPI0007854608|nr:aminotransferase class V-fold PLP-dependent enzyme [Endozoicomonas arenosclerae]
MTSKFREQFHIPDQSAYLLNHSVGCLPKTAKEHFQNHFLEPWNQHGSGAWEHWLNNLTEFNAALANILNGEVQQFCPQVNLSSALTKVIGSLPAAPSGSHILLSERDFPSMGFVIQNLCKSFGLTARFIPEDTDLTDLNQWDEVLTDKTWLAFITHVQSNDSLRLPVAEITALTRQKQIISVVDIAQSAGIVPIDLKAWNADFVIGSSVKWLCGGPGSGYLWASPSAIEQCEPMDVGWFSHQDPMEFDIHHFEYAEGVRRFAGGTPSIMPFTLSAQSIRTLDRISSAVIFEHNQKLINLITDQINREMIRSPLEQDQRGGTLAISFKDDQKALEAMQRAGIACDRRSEGLRFSPHIYNMEEEADQLIEVIHSL